MISSKKPHILSIVYQYIFTMLSNIDKDRILEEVEPLLVSRLKYASRTERGREITSEGREYLVDMRKRQG